MRNLRLTLVLLLVFVFRGTSALAFPEMVRHGYLSCTTCHISPDGSGIPTEYGRALSGELLSTWGSEEEGKFLYGAVTPPKWLSLGGDVRVAQTYRKSPTATTGRFIFMQGDFEAAAALRKWTAVATIGYQELRVPGQFPDQILSRRHYAQYRHDDRLTVRGGKFLPAIGIRMPEHIQETKRGLGFDEGTETYNLEVSYLAESYEVFATGIFGRLDSPSLGLEKGAALRPALLVSDRAKLGATYFFGTEAGTSRHVVGPFLLWGITPQWSLLFEADFQLASGTTGLYQYAKLAYEVVRGLHPFLTFEYARPDLGNSASARNTFGTGLQWYPRPHFDVQAMYQWRALSSTSSDQFAWLTGHFYL